MLAGNSCRGRELHTREHDLLLALLAPACRMVLFTSRVGLLLSVCSLTCQSSPETPSQDIQKCVLLIFQVSLHLVTINHHRSGSRSSIQNQIWTAGSRSPIQNKGCFLRSMRWAGDGSVTPVPGDPVPSGLCATITRGGNGITIRGLFMPERLERMKLRVPQHCVLLFTSFHAVVSLNHIKASFN